MEKEARFSKQLGKIYVASQQCIFLDQIYVCFVYIDMWMCVRIIESQDLPQNWSQLLNIFYLCGVLSRSRHSSQKSFIFFPIFLSWPQYFRGLKSQKYWGLRADWSFPISCFSSERLNLKVECWRPKPRQKRGRFFLQRCHGWFWTIGKGKGCTTMFWDHLRVDDLGMSFGDGFRSIG